MQPNEAHRFQIREPNKGDDLTPLFANMKGTIEVKLEEFAIREKVQPQSFKCPHRGYDYGPSQGRSLRGPRGGVWGSNAPHGSGDSS